MGQRSGPFGRPKVDPLEPHLELAAQQLSRMRGMNAAYHRRFFADIRFHFLVILALFALSVGLSQWFYLLIPVIALVGACQTAFDASYLIFSRQYATRLEQYINTEVGRNVLVAHSLEDAYLFPLDRTKVVTLRFGPDFSWFGFMTFFYTVLGASFYGVGLWNALRFLPQTGSIALATLYVVGLGIVTVAALGVGWWWFVKGEGERRLRQVLDDEFGTPPVKR